MSSRPPKRGRRVARAVWPVTDEQLSRRPIFGGLLGHGAWAEARASEKPEPDVAAEQSRAVGLVHHVHGAIGVAEQDRVLGLDPGVGGIWIPGPIQVADPPAVAVPAAT